MYCTASQTDGDTSMAGAGDEGAAGVAAPAIALGAWILLTPAMLPGTVLAAFALARTAGRTQLEATVMRSAELRKVHALLERRGFLAMLAARLRGPCHGPPGNRRRRPRCCATAASRVSVDDPGEDEQPGELRHIAWAAA
jgi:hypothetical protein